MDDGSGFLNDVNQKKEMYVQKNIIQCITSMLENNNLKQEYQFPHLQNNNIVLVGKITNITQNQSNTQSIVEIDDGFGSVQIKCLKRAEHVQTELLDGINTVVNPYVQVVAQILNMQTKQGNFCYLTGQRFTELSSHDMITNHLLGVIKTTLVCRRQWDDNLKSGNQSAKVQSNRTQSDFNGSRKEFNLKEVVEQMVRRIKQHHIESFDLEHFEHYFNINITKDQQAKAVALLIREGHIYQDPGTFKYMPTDQFN